MKKKDSRILLVDDEPDILEILGYNLSSEGYQVFTAENGVEALVEAKKHKPHLIILDVMMPEMDGIEACERLRGVPELNDTIITFYFAPTQIIGNPVQHAKCFLIVITMHGESKVSGTVL